MALIRRSKTDRTFFQDIPNPEHKEKLRDKIMDLMKERLKAREYKITLDKEMFNLNTKLRDNKQYIDTLDFRMDELTKRYIE